MLRSSLVTVMFPLPVFVLGEHFFSKAMVIEETTYFCGRKTASRAGISKSAKDKKEDEDEATHGRLYERGGEKPMSATVV